MIRLNLLLRLAVLTSVLLVSRPVVGQETIYGMTTASSASTAPGLNLVSFSSTTPGTLNTIGAFTGVVAGQGLRSIDFRPGTGALYALSSNAAAAQLYTVNLATAALTPVGPGFTLTSNVTTRLEIEFNPVTDTIRLLGGGLAGVANNYTISPSTGAIVGTHTNLAYATGDANFGSVPSIIGGAYSNNTPGSTTSTLYGWDFALDTLVTVGGPGGTPSPNGGQLTTIDNPNPAFLTSNAGLGMDISGATGTLFVTHDDPNDVTIMSLYTRNLTTGAETTIGAFGTGVFVSDISVQPVPEPTTVLLLGCLGLGVARLIRRKRAGLVVA